MSTTNDITGDSLTSKPSSEAYKEGWERIFGNSANCVSTQLEDGQTVSVIMSDDFVDTLKQHPTIKVIVDKEYMDSLLNMEQIEIPSGLDREQMREYILNINSEETDVIKSDN